MASGPPYSPVLGQWHATAVNGQDYKPPLFIRHIASRCACGLTRRYSIPIQVCKLWFGTSLLFKIET